MFDIMVIGKKIGECEEIEWLDSEEYAHHGCIVNSGVFTEQVPEGATITINYVTGEFRAFTKDEENGFQLAPLIKF